MRVLIGHLDTELPPYDTARFEVRAVRYRRDGQLPAESVAEMLAQCPDGWRPDVYYHASAVHFPVPADLEDFAGLTATNIQDWHRGGRAVWAAVERFDLVLTERNSGALLNAAGYSNTAFCRLWGVQPEVHRVLPDTPKDIDVLFIGSLNPAVWSERNRWVARLARLSSRHRVVAAMGHYGEHYVRLTNRAKIVFNRSVNGCTNQRAYDGLACGALVFNEAENEETRETFEDGVHCVYYSEENFEELLDYYLTHDAERERIAAAGRERVLAAHTEAHHFQSLLEILEAKVQEKREKGSRSSSLSGAERESQAVSTPDRLAPEAALRQALQIYSASLPAGAEQALATLDRVRADDAPNGVLLEAKAALHGWVAHHLPPGGEKIKMFNTAIVYAQDAVKADPNRPLSCMTLAFLLLERAEATQGRPPTGKNDIVEAAVALSQAAEQCESLLFEGGIETIAATPFPNRLDGFGFPRWADLFDCRVERAYLLRLVDATAWAQEMCRTVAWRCRTMLCDLADANGQREEALRQARAAFQDAPEEAEAILRLARCEATNGLLAESAQRYAEGLAISPLSYAHWSERAAVLAALGRQEELDAFLHDCEAIIAAIPSFAGVRSALAAVASRRTE